MKNKYLGIIFILSMVFSLKAQTDIQQKKAEAYYLNQEAKKRYSNSWNWLFNSSSSSSNYSKNNLVKWEYNDGGWYSGQGANNKFNGLGIQYNPKDDSYAFSNWKNTRPNGLSLVMASDGFSFYGNYSYGKKNGFCITTWPKYKEIIKYVGEYKESNKHGYGILYYRNGTYQSGIWIDNIFTKKLKKIEVLEALGF